MKEKIIVELVVQDEVAYNHLKRLLEPTYKTVRSGAKGDIVLFYQDPKDEPFGISLKQIKALTGKGKAPVVVISPDKRLKSSILRAGAVAFHLFPDEWHDTFLIIRNLYKTTYAHGAKANVADMANGKAPTAEEIFLAEVRKSLEKNLANSQYNLAMLCKDVHLSYSQLNRRFKDLSLKPSLHIRSYRLNRALDLLIQGGSSISEVSYKVGFNSPAYFTKCFKEEFGILPMEVKKQN